MHREIDGCRIEVRPFAQASKCRCEYVVSGRLKRRANALPTPASVPGTVDQNIRGFAILHEGLAFLLDCCCPMVAGQVFRQDVKTNYSETGRDSKPRSEKLCARVGKRSA